MGGWITNNDKDKDEETVEEAIKVIKDDKIHLPFFLHIISHHIIIITSLSNKQIGPIQHRSCSLIFRVILSNLQPFM